MKNKKKEITPKDDRLSIKIPKPDSVKRITPSAKSSDSAQLSLKTISESLTSSGLLPPSMSKKSSELITQWETQDINNPKLISKSSWKPTQLSLKPISESLTSSGLLSPSSSPTLLRPTNIMKNKSTSNSNLGRNIDPPEVVKTSRTKSLKPKPINTEPLHKPINTGAIFRNDLNQLFGAAPVSPFNKSESPLNPSLKVPKARPRTASFLKNLGISKDPKVRT
jgi:hypothetical protein